MDVSSSGITSEKESMYNSELRMCKEKIPAGSETESSSSSVTDAESSSSAGSVSTGDMVSIDSPLTLMIGSGMYDQEDEELDYVEPEYRRMLGEDVDEFEEVTEP